MQDATFEDGAEQPLMLGAQSKDDLAIISTFVQDAVGQTSEIAWMPKKRRFALLLNRFRWEDKQAANQQNRPYERVQTMLVINSALKVASQGIDPNDKELVFDLLSISFVESDDLSGQVVLTLAGEGAIAIDAECLDVTLQDVSRPYIARAKDAPNHPES